MATRLTSNQRAAVYKQIFLLNRSFHLIVQRLDDLAQARIFNPATFEKCAAWLRKFSSKLTLRCSAHWIHWSITIGGNSEKSVLLSRSD
jgi:hypothetical protein